MRLMKLLLLVSALLIGCRGERDSQESSGTSVIEIDGTQLPQRSTLNSRAKEMLKDWPAFQELEKSFEALYRVENNEDLILVVEEMIKRQNDLEDSEYPEAFDIPHVKSRQKVFKTYLLKLKAASEYRTEVVSPAIEMLEAYNAFLEQFNIVVNDTLDLNLILDE
ncbi:MAG: hypothetical protein HKP60_11530 [Eudoraea sp.]|nr:hypothetical protein [Eudoraea sp.]NNJ41490.1 hypothetical protein [Eudoraea sp.]